MSRAMKLVLLASLVGNLTIVWVGYKGYMYREYINYWLDKYETVVDEFSGRGHFAAANEALQSDTVIPRRVVFLGTQVTSRWDVTGLFREWEAINRGIEGQRLAGFVLRFWQDVVELGPSAVVIEISSYNFRPQWQVRELQEYAEMMATLARGRGIEPIFGTVIAPWGAIPELGGYRIMDSVAVFNEWLRAGERDGRWQVVDFNRLLADERGYLRRELAMDAIDPNAEGYRILTGGVREVLARVIGAGRAAAASE